MSSAFPLDLRNMLGPETISAWVGQAKLLQVQPECVQKGDFIHPAISGSAGRHALQAVLTIPKNGINAHVG
jgi:hypothetical protein